MSRWLFDHPSPALLPELNLELEAGQEFDAPEDWKPSPYPHPVFKEVSPSAPDKAPKE